jgi:glycosyltransferase involved in cell wall biosynthesis
MNFLIIAANSPKISKGGIERYMTNFIDYAKGKNDNFFFLFAVANEEVHESNGNVKVAHIPLMNKKFVDAEGNDLTARIISRQRLQYFYSYVQKYVRDNKIDIICAENFQTSAEPGYSIMLNMISQSEGVPLLLNLHSFATREIHEAIIKDLLWDKVICVSNSVAGDCFVKGVPADLLVTNHLGVNTDTFNPQVDKTQLKRELGLHEDTFLILHASRIISGRREILDEKGFTYLIEAFSRLSQKDDNLRILFAVALPPEQLQKEYNLALEKLRGYLKVYGVEEKVIIKNFELDEMPKVYSGSDLFILASENETFGQVIIESMACGTPVISSSVGGILEIVTSGQNGFLIQQRDVAGLERRMKDIITDETLRTMFSENGLETIRTKFLASAKFDSLIEIFRNATH